MKKLFTNLMTVALGLFLMGGSYALNAQSDFVEHFDGTSLPAGWTVIDADGDGYNWDPTFAALGGSTPYAGDGLIASSSYDNNSGPLTPDNWLITPQLSLGGSTLTYHVCAQDPQYAADHYGVFVSTTGTNPEDFTLLFEETLTAKSKGNIVEGLSTRSGAKAQGTWYERVVDLSEYSGNCYVAFRHFDCTDNFYMLLDEVTITLGGDEPPIPPTPGDAIVDADFEIGADGAKVAQTYVDAGFDFFTTWSDAPGGAEDAVFSKEQAYEGELSGKFAYGNDFVMLLGDKTAGNYAIDFNVFVPTGKDAYFNILHSFAGTSSTWACEVYINSSANGGTCIKVDGTPTNFAFPLNEWNAVHFDVDLDNDLAAFYVNDALVLEWQFSLDASGEGTGTRQLAAMDFFPPTDNNSLFYIDNIVVVDKNAGGAIFASDFEDAEANAKLGLTYPEFFTTWSEQPGGAEDAVITKENAASGAQSVKFAYGNDVVFLAGNQTAGSYDIDFNIFVPTGKDGYFNVLHTFAGTSSTWACEVYLNSSSNGTSITVDGSATNFNFPLNQWNAVHFDIDLDNDLAAFYVNDELVLEWQFSLEASGGTGVRQLAAMDFFPPTSAAVSEFYIDDFSFAGSGVETAPEMSVDVTEIELTLEVGDSDSQKVTVANSGTSIGDYVAWIDYSGTKATKGADEHFILSYCGECASAVGFTSGTPIIEVAARFTPDYYMEFIGSELKQLAYYGYAEVVGNKATFRVYGQGKSNAPGELLAEKSINNFQINYWNTITLDAPIALNGGDIWVAVEFQQAAEGTYPISFDGGEPNGGAPYNENGDFYRTNGGGWSRFDNPNEYGNICVRGFAEGETAPCWVYLSGATEGSLMAGTDADFNVMFDATNITEGDYAATLNITTNDVNNPSFNIPIALTVKGEDGIEDVENASVKMYPNPASDVVRVEAQSTINNVAVYNEIGQLVAAVAANGNETTISVSNLSAGVYFVRIDTNEGINISKLIVK